MSGYSFLKTKNKHNVVCGQVLLLSNTKPDVDMKWTSKLTTDCNHSTIQQLHIYAD